MKLKTAGHYGKKIKIEKISKDKISVPEENFNVV